MQFCGRTVHVIYWARYSPFPPSLGFQSAHLLEESPGELKLQNEQTIVCALALICALVLRVVQCSYTTAVGWFARIASRPARKPDATTIEAAHCIASSVENSRSDAVGARRFLYKPVACTTLHLLLWSKSRASSCGRETKNGLVSSGAQASK